MSSTPRKDAALAELRALRFRNAADRIRTACAAAGIHKGPIEIRLTGEIGAARGIVAAEAERQIRAAGSRDLRIVLNSHGGRISDAERIAAAIRRRTGSTSVHVTDQCSSAATLILLAADRRTCESRSTFLLHPASLARTAARWTAAEHRKDLAILAEADLLLAQTYARRTNMSPADIAATMAAEKPIGATAALFDGLVHQITDRPTIVWGGTRELDARIRGRFQGGFW